MGSPYLPCRVSFCVRRSYLLYSLNPEAKGQVTAPRAALAAPFDSYAGGRGRAGYRLILRGVGVPSSWLRFVSHQIRISLRKSEFDARKKGRFIVLCRYRATGWKRAEEGGCWHAPFAVARMAVKGWSAWLGLIFCGRFGVEGHKVFVPL